MYFWGFVLRVMWTLAKIQNLCGSVFILNLLALLPPSSQAKQYVEACGSLTKDWRYPLEILGRGTAHPSP